MTNPEPPEPEPVVDLTPDFLAAVKAIGTGLEGLRTEVSTQIAEEAATRDQQIGAEADIRARSDHRYRNVVIVDIILSVLIGVGYGGLWRANHDAAVSRHRAAVAACATTNKVREGIRGGFATDDSIWTSLVPPNATPAVRQIIAGVHAKFVAAEAAIPEIDCSKVK